MPALLSLHPTDVWLTRRFPLEQRTWRRSVLVHIPMFSFFPQSLLALCSALLCVTRVFTMLFHSLPSQLLTYGMWGLRKHWIIFPAV